ncbi:hypothetical protein ACFL6N_01630 [Thermodesulfobacteriota bacterium]
MAALPQTNLCRIAVLPFINETNFKQGEIIVNKVFIAELVQTGNYLIAHEGDLLKIYRQLRIFPGHSPDFEQLRILSDRLNVQLIITGKIHEMSEKIQKYDSSPSLAFSLQVFEANTGRTLWNTYHKREGEEYRKALHFGKVHTVTSLAQRMSEEILNLWLKEGFRICTD